MIASSSLTKAWMPNIFCRDSSKTAYRLLFNRLLVQALNPLPTAAVLLLLVAIISPAEADTKSDATKPINVKADQSDFDEKAGIQSLKGNVEITQGSLAVKADSIKIELKNGALFRVVGAGSPITFQQQTTTGDIMKGQSNQIEYNLQTTQITFSGDASFERPGQKLTGSSIMYNMSDLTFKASGDKKGRVNIVLQPTRIKR